MEKIKIGFTIGDINGIGPEILLKSLSNPKITKLFTPVIYASGSVLSYYKNVINLDEFPSYIVKPGSKLSDSKPNIINCWNESVKIHLGKETEEGGKYALKSLEKALEDINNGEIDAIITLPINKKTMKRVNFEFPGHTEYLADFANVKNNLMLMISDSLKIGLVTNHIPIKDVSKAITKELILNKLSILNNTLIQDFGKEKPIIAVLGLNPHAGDNGVIGEEEEKIIRPAIIEAKKKGLFIHGPFPADSFFGTGNFKKYDAVLAMYHDQGLAPFKAISFGDGVNYTAGMPFIRTSPDHGTGYDIAGTNTADPSSFIKAIFTAIDIVRTRKDFFEAREDAILKKEEKDTAKKNTIV